MFLSVEWAKRWLPAIFLLVSLFLPWWAMFNMSVRIYVEMTKFELIEYFEPFESFILSFLWGDDIIFGTDILETLKIIQVYPYFPNYYLEVYRISSLCFVNTLIVVGGLCGLSSKSRTRSLGGLLGIVGIISYLILVLHKSPLGTRLLWGLEGNPYFGNGQFDILLMVTSGSTAAYRAIWFISVGFYLALAGSLMLLLPLIKTFIERLRKRLQSSNFS